MAVSLPIRTCVRNRPARHRRNVASSGLHLRQHSPPKGYACVRAAAGQELGYPVPSMQCIAEAPDVAAKSRLCALFRLRSGCPFCITNCNRLTPFVGLSEVPIGHSPWALGDTELASEEKRRDAMPNCQCRGPLARFARAKVGSAIVLNPVWSVSRLCHRNDYRGCSHAMLWTGFCH